MTAENLAMDLRHEPKACDPMALAMELGLITGRGSFIRQTGGGITVRCVAHQEHSPSMSISRGPDGTARVRCFGCDYTADALGLIQTVRGCDFREALAELARITGQWAVVDELEGRGPRRGRTTPRPAPAASAMAPPVDVELAAAVFEAMLALCPLTAQPDVRAYVEGRGIFADAQAVGLGALPASPEGQLSLVNALACSGFNRQALLAAGLMRAADADRFNPPLLHPGARLLIPWRDARGRVTCLQRRRLDDAKPKYVFPSGLGPSGPFGVDILARALEFHGAGAEIVIVEGALDGLARRKIARHRDERAVVLAVASASAATVGLPLDGLRGRRVRLALDADEAGERACGVLAETLGGAARELVRERPPNDAKDWGTALARRMAA